MTDYSANFIPSSNANEYYRLHSQVMQFAIGLPVGFSYSLEKKYQIEVLKKIAEQMKPKKIVIVEHEFAFEVARLNDYDCTDTFYATIGKQTLIDFEFAETAKQRLILAIDEYFQKAESNVGNDQYFAAKFGMIPQNWIMRKLFNVAVFRKHMQGSSVAIKDALNVLEDEGVISKASEINTVQKLNSRAIYYVRNEQ